MLTGGVGPRDDVAEDCWAVSSVICCPLIDACARHADERALELADVFWIRCAMNEHTSSGTSLL